MAETRIELTGWNVIVHLILIDPIELARRRPPAFHLASRCTFG